MGRLVCVSPSSHRLTPTRHRFPTSVSDILHCVVDRPAALPSLSDAPYSPLKKALVVLEKYTLARPGDRIAVDALALLCECVTSTMKP